MDNTAKDNRNNIMWGFLASLVELNLVEEVELSFLPVGHTHEDIDAMFSRIAQQIKSRKCVTLDDLKDRISKSSAQTTVAIQNIDRVLDVAAWILPSCCHWQDSDPPPLHFLWKKVDDVTRVWTKMTAADDDAFLPTEGRIFFKTPLSLVPPCYVLPKFIDDEKLLSLIMSHKARLNLGEKPTAFDWWVAYIEEIKKRQAAICEKCLSFMKQLHSITPRRGPAYSKLVKQRNELNSQLAIHRASGCDHVERADVFPLFTHRVGVPVAVPPPVPVVVPPPATLRVSRFTLTPMVHQQLFVKQLAGLRTRSNELESGTKIAILGDLTQPYKMVECVDFEEPYFRYRY